MSILAVVLLVLFTLEIIFIFTYIPTGVQDDEPSSEPSVGPPQLPSPAPPIYINEDDYEFDGNFGRDHRRRHRNKVGGCSGTRYGCCPDSDVAKVDSDGSNCSHHKNHVLRRIHFFIVKNMKTDKREKEITIKPKFDHNNPSAKYKLELDKDIKDEMLLIADYHDGKASVKYTLEGDDEEILKGKGKGGTIKLGKIGDLKKYKTLDFSIKEK